LIGCTLIEDAKALMPSVTLQFTDTRKTTQNLGIFQDGSPLSILIGDGKSSNPLNYSFRQWSLKDGLVNTAGNYAEINGVADLVPWTAKLITKAQKGNASQVATQLAQQAGIGLIDAITTNDKMTWLPDGRTLGAFVRNVMDHAWLGSGACPHMALTSQQGQWMLRIKDLMQKSGATNTFASQGLATAGQIPIWDYRISSNGGALNSYTTYGHKVVQEMLNGSVNVWQNFTFSGLSSVSGINSALQGAMQVVRTFYHPPDTGNSHQNYAQALHNNRMARSTFSVSIVIQTDQVSTVKLMDDIQITLANNDGTINQAYSGQYKVSGISRHIGNGGYYKEIITATTQGTSAS
jgi:hypothetical protein